jgi:hypothetical protein
VRPRTEALSDALERLLPFLAFAAVVTAGWFWFVQPRLAIYLRARTDAAALEERVRTLQQASSRTRSIPPADLGRTQHEFEQRVSSEDRVADVAAAIAKAVLASAPADGLRAFVIDAGDRVAAPRGGGSEGGGDGVDPRMALFPYSVSYTPLRVSFESGFETAGDVLWRLRDLPTTVEVRAATLERGLPLMKTELVIRVLQRGEAMEVPGAVVPGFFTAPAPGPTAPRLGASATDQRGAR